MGQQRQARCVLNGYFFQLALLLGEETLQLVKGGQQNPNQGCSHFPCNFKKSSQYFFIIKMKIVMLITLSYVPQSR